MVNPLGQVKAGRAFIEVLLSNDQFEKDWAKFRSSLQKLNGVLTRLGAAATAFGGAISVAMGRMAIAAADAETGFRRFALIFGDNADMMRSKLEALSSDTGIAMTTLIRQSSSFGAVFSELGQQLGPEAFTEVVARAQRAVIDLSGIAGISTEEAADRIKSALTSTGESVDQYGFNLRQAEINQELMRMGINKNVRQLTELEKQLVKIRLIQLSIERGQLSFSNMTSTLNAKITQLRSNLEELWVTMTQLLLPILKVVVSVTNMLVRVLNMIPFRWLTSGFGLVVAIVGALSLAVGLLILGFVALTSGIAATIVSLKVVGTVIAGLIGPTGGLGVELVLLGAAFDWLAASIGTASAALWSFWLAAWPVVLVVGAIAAAILGLVWAVSKLAEWKTGKDVGMLDVVTGGGALSPDAEVSNRRANKRLSKFARGAGIAEALGVVEGARALYDLLFTTEREAMKKGERAAAGIQPAGVQSVIGSRLIRQQLAYGAGVTTPAQESAKQLSYLSQIAEQVLGDGGDSIRTTQAS